MPDGYEFKMLPKGNKIDVDAIIRKWEELASADLFAGYLAVVGPLDEAGNPVSNSPNGRKETDG